MNCPICGCEGIPNIAQHRCTTSGVEYGGNYVHIGRDLTPAEICQHYNTIIKEKDEEIERLKAEVEKLTVACKSAIPCLKDWIQTTGHGEVNRRDKNSLSLIEQTLAELGKKEE